MLLGAPLAAGEPVLRGRPKPRPTPPATELAWPPLLAYPAHPAGGVAVRLCAPLSTHVPVARILHPGGLITTPMLEAVIVVPDTAPPDLGVGAFAADDDGHWWQRTQPGVLVPGLHRLTFSLAGDAPLSPQHHLAAWDAGQAAVAHQAGVFFWSAQANACTIQVRELRLVAAPAKPRSAAGPPRLADLTVGGYSPKTGQIAVQTGERYHISFRPIGPALDNPFDDDQFTAWLDITRPDGVTERVRAFWRQPMAFADRGDIEEATPSTAGAFEIRYRPRVPGIHQATLVAVWQKGAANEQRISCPLPPLNASGSVWDDIVRVDKADPRFFSTGRLTGRDSFYWPIGLNLRSVWDVRSQQSEHLATRLTPDRGLLAYDAYLRRFAAVGGTAVEVWMSSWNLALEWRADWPGYMGVGRFQQINAERLDQLLDLCWQLGIRVNLVVRNHGYASVRNDQEWHHNPYNQQLGGFVGDAGEFFSDQRCLLAQERMHRYLIARVADHPAVLGWKLWSEMNLTAGGHDRLLSWHQRMGQQFRAEDVYDHPLTSHWSGNYETPWPSFVSGDLLDFVSIDAYHGPETTLALLINDSTARSRRSDGLALGSHGKPVLVTEFGGNWNACPQAQMLAEHRSGPWAAVMCAHGGSPMLWWFEWIDQNNHWQAYRGISRFMAGEDLRGREPAAGENPAVRGNTVAFAVPTLAQPMARSGAGELVSLGWLKPGRLLGYIADRRWAHDGLNAASHREAKLTIGQRVAAGTVKVEWWDCDAGTVLTTHTISHGGGELTLDVPPFVQHIAFKMNRADGEGAATEKAETAAPAASREPATSAPQP